MSILFGSARIDENGNASGGTAGDQTGKEVMTQTMYTHSKGWYIIRPKSTAHATKIASAMKTACNNSKIGYDQSNRLGIIKYGTATTTATECDCSSLVRQCVIEATGKDPGNFTTVNEASTLAATGLFEDKISYTSQSKTPVYNGDILVTKTKGHTGIIVSGNARSNSSASSTTTTTTSSSSSTTGSSSSITVDGIWGKKTTTALQKILGTTQDGLISNQRSKYKSYLTAIDTASWKFATSGSSACIKALQKKIGATADGIAGPATVKKLQKFVGTTQDGIMGTKTVTALQKWINKQ